MFVTTLAAAVRKLLFEHPEVDNCAGIGGVVPGVVEHATMRVLHAPTLGWRDVHLRDALAAATSLPSRSRTPAAPVRWRRCGRCVPTRSRSRAIWSSSASRTAFAVGVIMNGEVLRGRHNIAGEFGHVPLSLDGPRCRAAPTATGKPTSRIAPRWPALSAVR